MVAKKMALGKGLGALIPEFETVGERKFLYCGIEEIKPNPSQPRKYFDESKIEELAESIKEKGILEPLIVRKVDDGYELIVGERRWRAAQKAGLKEVPVIVKEAGDREALELSLIENLQREDLNPIEEAEAYKQLIDEFNLSQEELSKRIGKDRTTITNTLRLLKLSPEIKEYIKRSEITQGHARAILSLESRDKQKQLCELIINKGLSVRQAEAIAKRLLGKQKRRKAERRKGEIDIQIKNLQDSLRLRLGTKVTIYTSDKRGKILIEYYSFDDLERIVDTILGEER